MKPAPASRGFPMNRERLVNETGGSTRSRTGKDARRLNACPERERELPGPARVLLLPEGDEQRGPGGGGLEAAVEGGVAGAAEGDEQMGAVAAGAAVMDDEAGGGAAGAASGAIAGKDTFALAAEAAAGVDFALAAAAARAGRSGAAGAEEARLVAGRAHCRRA